MTNTLNEILVRLGLILVLSFGFIFKAASAGNHWADSVLHTLTIEEKIGQLIMVSAYSNNSSKYELDLEKTLTTYHIGGLVFFQGTAVKQAELINRYQHISPIPLFIGMDAEWGIGMRLDSILSFPRNMTLGAISDYRLIYNMGAEIALQCKHLGVNVNFAPVLDVNNNPLNPVINMRSFGENPFQVDKLGRAFINGLQDNGVMAVGKHFPGHGDTGNDSHYTLPVITHDMERLDSVELFPFKGAIKAGLSGIMVAHLNVPALEKKKNWPASLSSKIISSLLKDELDFNGLVFTDAMNMKGVTSIIPSGDAELAAFLAGNDIIVMPVHIETVINRFKKAINDKTISIEELDKRVLKILTFKNRYVIPSLKQVDSKGISKKLNENTQRINETLFKNAVTVVKDELGLLPFRITDTLSLASLSINSQSDDIFPKYLNKYGSFDHYTISSSINPDRIRLLNTLSSYDVVVLGLHGISYYPGKRYGMSQDDIQFINELNKSTQVVLVVFGNPYTLKYFEEINTVICAYEDLISAQKVVPQILFGAEPALGTLPVTASQTFREGTGIHYQDLGRLSYGYPQNLGIDQNTLSLIDTIVKESIQHETFPGCQVLIAKSGKIIYDRNFGYHTYDSLIAVSDTSIYDIASVTKVVGSIQALMMLYEKVEMDLDKKLSYYLTSLKGTNKEDLIIRDILTHQAGLLSYMPYWKYTLKKYDSSNDYYRFSRKEDFTIELTPDLYAKESLADTLWSWMIQSELIDKKDSLKPYEYKYSDIGFYLIQKLIEERSHYGLDEILTEYLFTPLNLNYLAFSPKNQFNLSQIVPSTIDDYFRNGIIQGNVHDENGSIYGGIAGHAGLFSNAHDLAVVMQMNLQKGYYGGIKYFQPETVDEFTRRQYKLNRRGLGWDKPQIIGDEYNPSSFLGSEKSYGHSGFTGTFVWADPEYELIYIFLSNRTYPDSNNKKLIDEDVRKRIQTIIYSAIIK